MFLSVILLLLFCLKKSPTFMTIKCKYHHFSLGNGLHMNMMCSLNRLLMMDVMAFGRMKNGGTEKWMLIIENSKFANLK